MVKRPTHCLLSALIVTQCCTFALSSMADSAPVEDLPGVLDLGAALEFAWENHPVMKEVQMRVGAAHGARVQAGLWPRPDVSFYQRERLGDEAMKSVELSQKFELGGKRGARVMAADAETFVKETEMLARWLDVRAQVKRSFAMAGFAAEALGIAQDIADQDAEKERLAASLFGAGRMAEADYVAVKKEAAESEVQVRIARTKQIDARRQALLAVGVAGSDLADRVSADVEKCRASLPAESFEGLREIALANNPDLLKAGGVLQANRAMERLARASRWCDLKVGVELAEKTMYGENELTDSGIGVEVSLDLPLWDRGQGRAAEAKSNAGAAQMAEASVRLKAESAVSEFLAMARAAMDEEKAYVEQIVPLAEKRSKLTKDLMDAGKVSGLEYLAVQRGLLDTRLKSLQVELTAVLASVELERLVAAPAQAH